MIGDVSSSIMIFPFPITVISGKLIVATTATLGVEVQVPFVVST